MEFCGIGPFRGPQSIDFDALTASGLFLIEGPTGSGKTTIIDAIVFALYGSLSGAESDAGRLRSHLCGPDEPTEVSLTFSVDGIRHTITRNPAYERLKARGSGTTSERARQTLIVDDGATPSMREAKEIGVYLQQRLGLSVEQFRRLVVLPQGEFDALLRAKPTDRYRTLASLIDDRMLERVQDELKRSADEAAQARSDAIARLEKAVTMGRQRASEVLDPESVVEADLDTLVASLEAEVSDAAVHVAALIPVLDAARQSDVMAQGSLQSARAAAEARQAIAQAAATLDPRDAALDDTGLRSRDAALVAQRTRLEPLAEWEAQGDQRDREMEIARATVAQLADALETTRAQAHALPKQVRALESELAQARAAAASAPALDAEVSRLESLAQSLVVRDDLVAAADRARATDKAASDALQKARDDLHAARTGAAELLRRQLDQRAAHLATLLVDGQACPVCGALEHPLPAAAGDEDLVIDDEVARAESMAHAAAAAESAAEGAYRDAQHAVSAIDKDLAALTATIGNTSPDVLSGDLERARAAARGALAAANSIEDLVQRQAAVALTQVDVASATEALVAQLATAQAARDAFDERVRTQTDRHRAELGDATSAQAAIAHIDTQRAAMDALLQARSKAAGLAADIDPEAAALAADEAKAALTAAESDHLLAQQRAVRATEAVNALLAHRDEWRDATAAAAATSATTAAAIELGALVTARSNANIRKLTLQAYAVQRRFRAVLEAASVHLERMSSGKYAFALDEASSGNAQSGLGIDIVDAWSGQHRDPATLSGGETFYASLSLALGLADVVREESGGVTLETLFVDEGFGSLDADTLSVVLDQLDALRARGRAVGVISHVAEMKEWVHDRIEVLPGTTPAVGSCVRQSGL